MGNGTRHHRLRVFFMKEKQGQDLLAVKDQEWVSVSSDTSTDLSCCSIIRSEWCKKNANHTEFYKTNEGLRAGLLNELEDNADTRSSSIFTL